MSLSRAARLHALAAHRRPVANHHGRFAGWAIAYALFIAYASTIVGPSGFNFVPVDPEVAWRMFKATPYITSDAGPRADWIANLLMLVPMGVLATGAFWPRRERMLRWLAAGAALFCCLLFVLSIKYLQLFFPPRTVTLNYIEAQSLGSLLGVALFWAGYDRLFLLLSAMWGNGRRFLMIVCGIYAVALLLFFLFPFDFVLSTQELRERAAILPQQLFSWPGAGLSTMHRAVWILAGSAATAPLGVFLALRSTRRSLFKIAIVGFLAMSAITLVTMLVLSAAPSLISVVYRSAGVVIGAAVTTWFEEQGSTRWRNRLARLVPLAILPYVLAVFFVNDLLTPHWRTVPQALAALNPFGLLPFYHHYIVSKAHAATSVAVHLLTFAPIGVMVALRRGAGRAEVLMAGILAALLSFAVELGRWFKPDLQPDFSDVIIAAVAAGIAAKLTAALWSTSDGTLARPTASARNPVRSPPMAGRQSVDRRSETAG